MRSVSAGLPDEIEVVVENRTEDGRYRIRRDHWTSSILARVSPLGEVIPTPTRMKAYFEDGDRNRPILYWQSLAPGLMGPGTAAAVILSSWWYAEHVNWGRDNSWTSATWQPAGAASGYSLAARSGVAVVDLIRFRDQTAAWVSHDFWPMAPGDGGYDDEKGQGEIYLEGPYLFISDPSTGPYWQVRHNLGEGIELGTQFEDTFQVHSCSLLSTGEALVSYTHGKSTYDDEGNYTGTETHYLGIYSTTERRKRLRLQSRLHTGDISVECNGYICTPVLDEWGNFRLSMWPLAAPPLEEGEDDIDGDGGWYALLLNTADEVGLPSAVWDGDDQFLPHVFASADAVFVQDYYGGGIYSVDPANYQINWTYTGSKAIRLLALNGSQLVCQWASAETTEVVDEFYGTDWNGTRGQTPREELARGHCVRGGLLYLSASNGGESAVVELTETKLIAPLREPVIEYLTTSSTTVWTPPPRPAADPTENPNRAFSGFGGLLWVSMISAAGRNYQPLGYRPHETDEGINGYTDTNEDGQGGSGDPSEFGTAHKIFNDLLNNMGWHSAGSTGQDVYGGEAQWVRDWTAEFMSRTHAWKDAEVQRFFRVLEGRNSPSDYMRIQRTSLRFPVVSWPGGITVPCTDHGVGYLRGSSSRSPEGSLVGYSGRRQLVPFEQIVDVDGNPRTDLLSPGLYEAEYWVTTTGSDNSWQVQFEHIWQPEWVFTERRQTVGYRHGAVVIAHGLVVFPPIPGEQYDGSESAPPAVWRAHTLSNLAWVWTFEVPPVASNFINVGNTWADSGHFWISYDLGDGTGWVQVPLARTGQPAIDDPAQLPGDGYRVVFDGQRLHGGDWALEPGFALP